jgi:glutamate---cysteine ligase / carboxylate-amine ligase
VLIESMLTFLRPELEAQGDWDEVSQIVRKTFDHGKSARRQLWAFAQSGRLEDVIDLILRETVQGL